MKTALLFIPYILKTLWRHRTRTLLTMSGAAVAFFVFCFVGAIGEGLDNLTKNAAADRTLIVFQANRFCPFTSLMPEDYARTIKKMPGVQDVVPIKVFTNNCRASLDVVVFHGIPTDKLKTARDFKIVAGDWADYEKRTDGALVGRALANRRHLNAGDAFTVGGVTVKIGAIYSASAAAEEDFVYTPLEFLQRLKGKNDTGKVTQFEVRLQEGADAKAVAKAIDDEFHAGPVATDTRTKGVFQENSLGDLVELIRSARWLGYACVALLVFALVATTTVMAVQDRLTEHGVLQTLGFTGQGIFALVVTESSLVSLAGGIVGTILATAALAWSGITLGAEGVSISFDPSWHIALLGIGVSGIVGAIAGVFPAWTAARTEIVAALRAV